MSIRSFIETIVLMVAIALGAVFNFENKTILCKFLAEHESIVAALIGSMIAATIVGVGWFCAYTFHHKVQEKKLKNDIISIARKEIIEAAQDYQKNLRKINREISGLKFLIENNFEINWQEKLLTYNHMFYSLPDIWKQTLEDYQILFPETEDVRIQLHHRDVEISNLLIEFDRDLMLYTRDIYNESQIKCLVDKANITILGYILDQIGLMEDLQRYLRNCFLSQITSNKILERQPLDPSTPRIIMNYDTELLEIYNNVVGVTEIGKRIQEYNKNS